MRRIDQKDVYCTEVYDKIKDCPDLPSVITTIALMGYRIVRSEKPHDKKYAFGHISIAHPDHESVDNPLWISGYKTMKGRASWVVR